VKWSEFIPIETTIKAIIRRYESYKVTLWAMMKRYYY
jgi:hypothetical protein